jgi:hypothetical protein
VWTRTAVQLAAEEQRRRAAAAEQSKGLLDGFGAPGQDPKDP